MSNDLIARASYRVTTPTVHEHAHKLDDFDPLWGLFPDVVPGALSVPVRAPPPPVALRTMLAELEAAQRPCSVAEAATVAGMLIAAHPSRDTTTSTYATMLAKELQRVPTDQLGRVFDHIIDASEEFRPTIGRVRRVIEAQLAKRAILKRRIEAALRYWQHLQAERDKAAEAKAPIDLTKLRRIPTIPAGAGAEAIAGSPAKPRAKPLAPDVVQRLRAKRTAK